MFKNFVCTPKCAHAQGKGRRPRGSRGARRRMPRLPHGRAWNPRWQSMRRWRGKRKRIGWARPGKPEHQRALFASFSKKEVPRRDQAHKTLRYHMRKLQRRRLSHRFPHPWRPIPFALSTVRNGRVALPQERLPSASLLTGLPPRCIPHCGRSAPPLSKGAFWLMRFQALSEYENRWSSPPPNAPFLKGGGSARALTKDCLAADVARHIIQRLRPFIPPRRSWPRRPKNRSPCSAPPRRNTWQVRSRRWCGSGARPACPDQSKRRI